MKDYKNIWECFVQDMDFDHKLIKKDILDSWKRCKEYGVSLYDFDKDLLMKPEEKYRYVLKCLPEYKEPQYKEFCNIVENVNYNISVYDNNAKLKYIVNYDDIFDELYPKIGYFLDVSESKIGTNSTCLAILENKPFMVIGPDHYKYVFHRFSCAAAPFYDENNEIAGTINASFINTTVNNDTLNIIYSLARLYETLILKRQSDAQYENTREKKKKQSQNFFTFNSILGQSEAINQAKKVAKRAAGVDTSILIYGESGCGKEVFAQAIHNESPRSKYPFVAINCGAIPKDLVESELFGYEAGAFTGAASRGRKGLLEYASGGTVFFDEIENMPLPAQVKILRALSSSTIMRIGGNETIPIDIRVISASKKNLEEEIKKGRFREDLFYRINVIQINIPPLRERKDDIKPILEHYVKTFSDKNRIKVEGIEDEFIRCLEAYHWPGNIRELINIIERSLVLSENGIINDSVLPSGMKESYMKSKIKQGLECALKGTLPEGKTLLQLAEDVIIESVYKEEQRNLTRTAKRLGISRPTLYKRIKKLDVL
ncbi:MAG: sigma-54-dependent Fis family transcriptional regulator [Gracilibacteraceae bacterium]|nr:sigma-54-dependent Fis family transcriptional regulator [Gracilibacteraceae bacterium]